MASPNEPELTLEARQAIRAYLLKLLALPAIVISILSFALGYGFQKEAASNALTEAMKVIPKITEASVRAQMASDRADAAKTNIEDTLAATTKLFNDLKRQDDLQKALHQADNLIASLAKAITTDLDFRREIIAAAGVVPHAEQGRTDVGSLSGHVTFTTHFTEPPRLMIGLGHLDEAGPPRVHLEASKPTTEGFDYRISTFGGAPGMPPTALGQADTLWIAVGK